MLYCYYLNTKERIKMKMEKILPSFLSVMLMLFLSACSSGISQSDYDALASENESLKSEVESLTSENESLSHKYNELLDEHSSQLVEDTSHVATVAWANTSFGNKSICMADEDGKHLQCIAGNTYPITPDGITNLWSDLLMSVKTLAYTNELIKYETISVKFLDPSGTYILDITLDTGGNSDMLKAMMCNVMYADTIIPALSESVSK